MQILWGIIKRDKVIRSFITETFEVHSLRYLFAWYNRTNVTEHSDIDRP